MSKPLAQKGVWCHICPMKDVCPSAQNDASFRIGQETFYNRKNKVLEGDYEKRAIASNNCPFLKVLV